MCIYNYLNNLGLLELNRMLGRQRCIFKPLATEYLTDSTANATPTVIGLSTVSKYYRHEFGTDGVALLFKLSFKETLI